MNKNTTEIAPGIKVTDAEMAAAKKEGALDALKEGAARAVAVDTGTTADPDDAKPDMRVAADYPTTFIAPLLDLPVDELVRRMTNDKVLNPIDLEAAKALLALERAGQNRTPYVKALCSRIGVESPYEVTSAGPAFTNDVSNVSAL